MTGLEKMDYGKMFHLQQMYRQMICFECFLEIVIGMYSLKMMVC